MTEAFKLTAKAVSPAEGMYAYIPNKPQVHNAVFYSSTSTDTIHAGAFVKLNSSSTSTVAPSVVACAATDIPFGMVVYDTRKDENAVGDKLALAETGDIVYLVCGGAVDVGDKLQFNATSRKVDDTTTQGNAYIGFAVTKGSADGDLIQVKLDFNLGVGA